MKNEKPCLESYLQDSRSDPDAVLVLRGIHTFYSQEDVSDGVPIPIVHCPLRQCGRERVVEFIEDDRIATVDDDNPVPCLRGLSEVIIEYVPHDETLIKLQQPLGLGA